jgi:hypothetical protein
VSTQLTNCIGFKLTLILLTQKVLFFIYPTYFLCKFQSILYLILYFYFLNIIYYLFFPLLSTLVLSAQSPDPMATPLQLSLPSPLPPSLHTTTSPQPPIVFLSLSLSKPTNPFIIYVYIPFLFSLCKTLKKL